MSDKGSTKDGKQETGQLAQDRETREKMDARNREITEKFDARLKELGVDFNIPPEQRQKRIGETKSTKNFRSINVYNLHDLSHLSREVLEEMTSSGRSGKTREGRTIILHHLEKNPTGPIIELPNTEHWGRPEEIHTYTELHPSEGKGLTPEQRNKFGAWKVAYWKDRAREEIERRKSNGG